MLIGPSEGLTPLDFVLKVSCQGHKGHFCNKWFLLIIFRTIYHRAFMWTVLIVIVLSMGKTPIDFGLTWSKVKAK